MLANRGEQVRIRVGGESVAGGGGGREDKKGFGRDERRPMAARHDAEFPHAVSHHVCFSTASYDL